MHAHPVAEVEVAQRLERFVADDGLGDEQLHFVVAVAHRGEDELAGVAHQHHAPGDGHLGLGFGAGIEGAVLRALVDLGVELDIDWAVIAGGKALRAAVRESVMVRRRTVE